jgi:ribonuclease P/MRP protein subunit POP7
MCMSDAAPAYKCSADARIEKRPLLRPPIPPPHANASTPKVVYIQRSTPFMSAVSRVRSLLRKIDQRSGQSARDKTRRAKGDRILAAARCTVAEASREEVVVRGSGRAIEKVLQLAAWFTEREASEGVRVKLSTESACAIDDIILQRSDTTPDPAPQGDAGQLPESRVRQVSVLEAKISRP